MALACHSPQRPGIVIALCARVVLELFLERLGEGFMQHKGGDLVMIYINVVQSGFTINNMGNILEYMEIE